MLFKSSKYDMIIAGLGNPESKYENTKHNIGFRAIDVIADKCGASFSKSKFNAMTADVKINGKSTLLIKPLTYMNLSGEAVSKAMSFYKLTADKLVVLCDDVSFDVGTLRIRKNGSHGGHNGLKNISLHLKTDDYMRVKIGVGKKPEHFSDLADWVLSPFSIEENKIFESVLPNVYEAVKLIVSGETEKAMNFYNKKAR